jgi:hypothetical protein
MIHRPAWPMIIIVTNIIARPRRTMTLGPGRRRAILLDGAGAGSTSQRNPPPQASASLTGPQSELELTRAIAPSKNKVSFKIN